MLLLEELMAACGGSRRNDLVSVEHNNIKWTSPLHGLLKYNVDASFSSHSNKVGIDICIRDEMGLFVGARTTWLEPILYVLVGETKTVLTAICWTKELEIDNVIFTADSKIVSDASNK